MWILFFCTNMLIIWFSSLTLFCGGGFKSTVFDLRIKSLKRKAEFFCLLSNFFIDPMRAYFFLLLCKEAKCKINTTRILQDKDIWHSNFCQFLNIMKHFYYSSLQMQEQFVVSKVFHYSNLCMVLPWRPGVCCGPCNPSKWEAEF